MPQRTAVVQGSESVHCSTPSLTTGAVAAGVMPVVVVLSEGRMLTFHRWMDAKAPSDPADPPAAVGALERRLAAHEGLPAGRSLICRLAPAAHAAGHQSPQELAPCGQFPLVAPASKGLFPQPVSMSA